MLAFPQAVTILQRQQRKKKTLEKVAGKSKVAKKTSEKRQKTLVTLQERNNFPVLVYFEERGKREKSPDTPFYVKRLINGKNKNRKTKNKE